MFELATKLGQKIKRLKIDELKVFPFAVV